MPDAPATNPGPGPTTSPTHGGGAPRPAVPAGLVALGLGGFGIGLTEFVIAGLLPGIATDGTAGGSRSRPSR